MGLQWDDHHFDKVDRAVTINARQETPLEQTTRRYALAYFGGFNIL